MRTVAADRLTALDESFLSMERPGLPMHVASVATFEAGPLVDGGGALRLDDICGHVAARASLLPRLRHRLWTPPGGIDHRRWVDDEHFDVRRHIDVVEAPAPGDDDALRRLAAEAEAELLPRDRPLWHMRFVTGLRDGRVGLIQRTHHAMVDGVSGVDIAAVILDLTPEAGPDVADDWQPAHPPGAFDAVFDALRGTVRTPAWLLHQAEEYVRHPVTSLQRGQSLADALGTVLVDGLGAPACSLNVPVGPRRDLAWIRTELPALKGVGRRFDATLNDVVLTAIAGGLRAQFVGRGETVDPHRTVKILVPVSLRTEGERGALGNRVGAYLLHLPVGVESAEERLAASSEAMRRLKTHHEATASHALLGLADLLPTRVAEAIARGVDSQSLINLVVTNVPGPRDPLYLLGSRMLEAFPIVPLGGNLSLGVAILSYGEMLTIGVTVDPDTCTDVETFVAGVHATLDDLATR